MHLLFFTWLTEQADGLIRRFYIFGIAAAPAAAISLVLPLLPEQVWTGVSAAEPFVCGQSVNKITCRVSLQTLGLAHWFSSLQPPVKAECGLGPRPGCLGAPVRNCWAVRLLSLPFPGPLPRLTPDAPLLPRLWAKPRSCPSWALRLFQELASPSCGSGGLVVHPDVSL